MTNTEARQILIDYNAWRRGDGEMLKPKDIGIAIDAAIVALGDSDDLTIAYQSGYFDGKRSKSSIAQAIRDAAIDDAKTLGYVEMSILDYAFNKTGEGFLHMKESENKTKARTFMLLVAEALES
jgi:hypothetical protein